MLAGPEVERSRGEFVDQRFCASVFRQVHCLAIRLARFAAFHSDVIEIAGGKDLRFLSSSSPHPGQTMRRNSPSARQKEQPMERAPPSPIGRSTPRAGLRLPKGPEFAAIMGERSKSGLSGSRHRRGFCLRRCQRSVGLDVSSCLVSTDPWMGAGASLRGSAPARAARGQIISRGCPCQTVGA
jgi:hypothetical protein